jgi:hypothetical protein
MQAHTETVHPFKMLNSSTIIFQALSAIATAGIKRREDRFRVAKIGNG